MIIGIGLGIRMRSLIAKAISNVFVWGTSTPTQTWGSNTTLIWGQ